MDIIEFQNKLKEVQTLALNNGKKVKAALVEKFFEGDDITQDKLQKVYDFLEIQGPMKTVTAQGDFALIALESIHIGETVSETLSDNSG